MGAPFFPLIFVEVGFQNNPGDSSITWTTLPDDVITLDTTMGRQHELDRTEASTLRVLLDNRQAAYSPWNTGSPNYVAPITTSLAYMVGGTQQIGVPVGVASAAIIGSLVTGQGLPATGARITARPQGRSTSTSLSSQRSPAGRP